MAVSEHRQAGFFEVDWLSLRESVDHAARSPALTHELAGFIGDRLPAGAGYELVDLGCGTGSNLRYLVPLLPAGQRWTLIDHDASHLARADDACRSLPGIDTIRCRRAGLDRPLDSLIPRTTHIVTASALIDLVSRAWLERLVARCAECGAAVLVALSYSGTFRLTPARTDDDWILSQFNDHQCQDKGAGPALGPEAWPELVECLQAQGYAVQTAAADWQLGPEQGALQVSLLQGWAQAVAEQCPMDIDRVRRWLDQRLRDRAADRLTIEVAHRDVLGLPAAAGAEAPE
ncbi:class I SAM-dependent methyltransferase [Marinobacter bohaiensis]|uniref:class I SAM-dependent methyltransferase n=1 Tax=Marinobacter bohaiensis TaxID=2201898 RepID=UPI0013A6D1A9|nr:class I SAM-dependent methyltransferase [Marinobacter bohaiensis]